MAALACSFLCLPLPAQTPTNYPPARAVPAAAPAPPSYPSPVGFFRALLAADSNERRAMLADRTPENQAQILQKVRDYQALRPEEQAVRLRVTELSWYLTRLLKLSGAQRAARLAEAPDDLKKLLEDRLKLWDMLPDDLHKELLDNAATIRRIKEAETQSPHVRADLTPEQRQKEETDIQRWQAMPETRRARIIDRFNEFFTLTDAEQNKTLSVLSEPERQQIEKTLHSFEQLDWRRRAECLRSFEKFAGLSVEDRAQFLKSAERWKLMTPSERQTWRNLVKRQTAMPPMPPDFGLPLPPPPPPRAAVRPAVVTNGN